MLRFKNQKFLMLFTFTLLILLVAYSYFRSFFVSETLIYFALFSLLAGAIFVLFFFTRKEQKYEPSTNVGSTNSVAPQTPITSSTSNVRFQDISGISDVKVELEEIVQFLKEPHQFERLGIRMPRGILLIGPPGVGKTMMAKAVAAEAGVPFFYQSGASFVHIYVGMGASRVRELFIEARRNAPSIIFIDEIDAVGKSRGGSRNDEREATLNQLLTEMDGFEESTQVVVIAATNKIEMLDSALLRPGRFDRRIFVSLPTPNERAEIASAYLSKIKHRVNSEDVAQMSVGFSPAMISSLINEAAIQAFREGSKELEMTHIETVRDRVQFGKKRVVSYTQEQKKQQALYQSARAVSACWFDLPYTKSSLFSDDIDLKDKTLLSKNELNGYLKLLLSGMAASEIYYGEHFANVKEDIKKARLLAQEMVNELAMGEHIVPLEYEITHAIEDAYKETKKLLGGMRPCIDKITRKLIEQEYIDRQSVKECLDEVL